MAGIRTVSDLSTRLLLRKHGLGPDMDVKIVTPGGTSLRLAALRGGQVDGTLLSAREIGSMVYEDGIKLFSDTGIPADAAVIEEIETAKEILGISRDISISEVADWSFARAAFLALK